MIFLGLLRHGEVVGGPRFRGCTDDSLTKAGWEQMHIATQGPCHWDLVMSSPLRRCVNFAREYAFAHRLPLEIEEDLQEINFGDWEGLTAEAIMQCSATALGNFWRDPMNHPPPGGETLGEFHARVVSAWQRLNSRHTGKRVLLVTHGGVIRVLLCHLQRRPLSTIMEIEVAPAALFGLMLVHDRIEQLFTSGRLIQRWLGEPTQDSLFPTLTTS
jgi:alpha-ribazole phosphatase